MHRALPLVVWNMLAALRASPGLAREWVVKGREKEKRGGRDMRRWGVVRERGDGDRCLPHPPP